jgi:PAS domain S-box-containing protein
MITPHRDANREIEYLICAGRDITTRKRTENELRTLIDVIPHFIWMMRPDGSTEYMSQSWCDYTGMTQEQVEGDGWLENLHPDDRARVLETWNAAIQAAGMYEVEYRVREGRTGEYHWFLARGIPMRDERGVVQRWLGTCTDIDGQKRVEQQLNASKEELRQSQGRLSVLMSSSIIGIFLSEHGQIIEANDAFLHLSGYSREDLQAGKVFCSSSLSSDSTAHMLQMFKKPLTQRYETSFEDEYLRKDGSIIPVLVSVMVLQADPLQVVGFVLDDSARKELERRKDDFISMAGHELKTPLTALKLQTQLIKARLARQGLYEAAADLVRVEAPTGRLGKLIEELLDVSKIQAGWLEYVRETVVLDVLLRDLVTTMQQVHPTHTIVLHEPLPSLSLPGDRARIEQVFANLISNAIKYSPNARLIEFDIAVSADTVTVSVRDHGVGISQEQCKKIFERFYRGFDPRRKMVPGLGMGLYIAAEIVKYHGGTITVESEVGRGSNFQVTLPLEKN